MMLTGHTEAQGSVLPGFTGMRAHNKIQVSPLIPSPSNTLSNNKAQVCLAAIRYCVIFPATLDTSQLHNKLFYNSIDCLGPWTKL